MLSRVETRKPTMNFFKLILFTLSIFLISACSESKYEKMSYTELKEKQRHCDSVPKKSTVFATGCENIRKEIERRKEEKRASGK
jgi:hypothetical protein